MIQATKIQNLIVEPIFGNDSFACAKTLKPVLNLISIKTKVKQSKDFII